MPRSFAIFAAGLFAALLTACTTPAPPTEPPFTGTWTGQLPIGPAHTRTFTVQLHERNDLSLMGYMPGGTSYSTIPGGVRFGDNIILVFELKDAGLTRTILLSGSVAGDTLTGTASDDAVSISVTWTRSPGPYDERRLIFIDAAGSGDDPTEIAVVLDGAGALLSGGYVGASCDFMSCGGDVTGFSETPAGALTINMENGGSCSGAGTITATFDATRKFYDGNWSHTDDGGCGGAVNAGTLIGGRDMGTNSGDAASILASLGVLADDLEAGAVFAAPYAPVADSYLHYGMTKALFLAEQNSEVAAHAGANVDFGNFKSLRTVAPVGINPLLSAMPIVAFKDLRSDAGGIYREVDAQTPGGGGLNFISNASGAWCLTGNQVGEFDLPFPYALGAEHLLVPAGSGPTAGTLYLSLGGWGAHFGPLTGHLEGNGKADMFAHYVAATTDLTELENAVGGTLGVCEVDLVWSGTDELCGFWGGLSGDIIRDRIFRYFAPYDGEVLEITYEERPRPPGAEDTHYFDNVPHWSMRIAFDGGLTFRIGHLGQITGAVKAGLIAATGTDPDSYTPSAAPGDSDYCPPSPGRCTVDVLGGASFRIAAGDEIAKAQTDAAEVPDHDGYFRGQIGPSIAPWGAVEFFMSEEPDNAGSADVCAYQYLPAAKQAAMATLMTADMNNPSSLRYAETGFVRPWKFRAEAELCNNGGFIFRDGNDFSSIHAQFGGWYERPEPGATADEHFTIARIHKSAGAYDPSLYDVKIGTAEKTDFLVARARTDGAPMTWNIPGAGPTPVWYPTGEVLKLTPTSFVAKWREISDPAPGITLYQRAALELDPGSGLKIKWGALSLSLAGAIAPVLAPGEACNDVDVLCYGRERP